MGSKSSTYSTIHADHSERDIKRIKLLQQIIADVYSGKIAMPPFAFPRHVNPMEIIYISHPNRVKEEQDNLTNTHLEWVGHPYRYITAITTNGTGYEYYNLTSIQLPCTNIMESLWFTSNIYYKNTYIKIEKLCIGNNDNMDDVTQTLSHLKAIFNIYDEGNINNYALILGDTMQIVLDIDISAYSHLFPPDFAIIQVCVANDEHVTKLRKYYTKRRILFTKWSPSMTSASAYIINKRIYMEYLNASGLLLQRTKDTFKIDLIAGIRNETCLPAYCCDTAGGFVHRFPWLVLLVCYICINIIVCV